MIWLSGVALNYLVGVIVCASIDAIFWPDEERLLKWAHEIPLGTIIVASLWPIILAFAIRYHYKYRRKKAQP